VREKYLLTITTCYDVIKKIRIGNIQIKLYFYDKIRQSRKMSLAANKKIPTGKDFPPMSTNFEEEIKKFSDQYLVVQCFMHGDQYIDEAKKIMEEEIALRKIDKEIIAKYVVQATDINAEAEKAVNYDKKEFTKLEGGFNANDSLIIRSMLNENKIPFIMDASTSLLPFDGKSMDLHLIDFHIHNNSLDTAKTAINEHFDLIDGRYVLKYSDIKTRLKSFNFYEIPHALIESNELSDVNFSKKEKDVLVAYGSRLLDEVDEIEKKQDRAVFYYDSWEDLIDRLNKEENPGFTHTDLLAALEVMQIYCDDTDFPTEAEGIAESLMEFFSTAQNG
jgi:hypothetical protein